MPESRYPDFGLMLIDARAVSATLDEDEQHTLAVIHDAYLAFDRGECVNPPSLFLRFPTLPSCRTIALPAISASPSPMAGIKWISSFPQNVARGFARASSVIVLNDMESGYPIALLEGSVISATRTAASAAITARALLPQGATCLGVIGAGLIARETLRYLAAAGIKPAVIRVNDLDPRRAVAFAEQAARHVPGAKFETVGVEEALSASELVVFATIASEPHVHDASLFAHHPVVLHLSLRDLDPAIILSAENIVDDFEHVTTANTSIHLASQADSAGEVETQTIGSLLMAPRNEGRRERTTIVSPFGLGVLDIALGTDVAERCHASGRGTHLAEFFSGDTVPLTADGMAS